MIQKIHLILECQLPELVGDGFCHDYTNNRHCAFDRGDCCGSCVNTDNCIKCQCKTGKTSAITNALVGDGYCHDYLNNVTCNFDGGDCCGDCVVTKFCSDCDCIGEITGIINHPFVGDGICNDEFNYDGCMFDGLDCCKKDNYGWQFDVNTEFCTDCSCHGMYIAH